MNASDSKARDTIKRLQPVSAASLTDILIADDSDSDRLVLKASLEAFGFCVREARSGRAAIDLVAGSMPEVVLASTSMADMDGFEVCARVCSADRSVPVLLLASSRDALHRCRAIEVGANDLIKKPVDLLDLQIKVRNAVTIKRLQDDVRRAREYLREAHSMQREWMGSIVQELKSPIAQLEGYLYLLGNNSPRKMDPDEVQLVRRMEQSAQQLSQMVGLLCDLNRFEQGSRPLYVRDYDARLLVELAIEPLRRREGPSRIAIEELIPNGSVRCDSQLIVRVIQELVENALKRSPKSAPVDVSLRNAPHYFHVEVRDRGTGLSRDEEQTIFEKIRPGGLPQNGDGPISCLAFARLAVEAHGGSIGVDNIPNLGARFWFRIPVSEPLSRSEAA